MSAYTNWVYTTVNDALTGATVKAMLLGKDTGGTDYVQDNATQSFRADVTAFEVAGTGYTAGGVAVTGLTITAPGDVHLIVDDIDFGTLTLTVDSISAVVLYVDTGDPATDVLIAADVFPAVALGGADNFTYVVAADGFVLFEVL